MTDFWKGKNVLVTGADGFIGSWVAKGLIDQGANVFTIVRDLKKVCSLDLLQIKEKLTIIQGDIIDYALVERTINEKEIDTVYHLAAQALVQVANASPLSTFKSNIEGTWNILEACRLHNVERVIVASSDKAYGVQKELPYNEDSPLHGLYPYDASKACADILTRSYATSFKLNTVVTRNANTYGPADLNFSRIIPDAIVTLLEDKEFIIRSDGTPERDYIYIKDVVEAYLKIGENMENKHGQAFNFGSGIPTSVKELFATIAKVMGKDVQPKIEGKANNEIDRQFLDITLVTKTFDWKPKYNLEQGLKETVEWYQNNKDKLQR
tara:strand:- start:346 stop:1317 length:972 start_codon:yes stop_codon:yes gene_type:complete